MRFRLNSNKCRSFCSRSAAPFFSIRRAPPLPAPICRLPRFQVYDIKASAPEAVEVPAEELERAGQAEDLVSRHTLMLTSSDFVTWFDVTHRVVPRADGSVCDAPSLVRIGFGSSRRFAFLARAAAADVCVRQEMLEHEAAHSRALDEVVDRFIEQQQRTFEHGMATLKQTPAPSEEIAKERWETGLRAIVAAAKAAAPHGSPIRDCRYRRAFHPRRS